MHDQLTVSSSVLPSCAQHSRHHHRSTQNTSSSPSRRRRRPCRSWCTFGVKSFWAKCWLRRLRLRRGGGGVPVRALMKGVGSMKRYRKEGSERRLRGDASFANKAIPPSGLRPCPPPPLPLEQREKGGKEKGWVGVGGGGRERGRGEGG
jgi:hypothetical protein